MGIDVQMAVHSPHTVEQSTKVFVIMVNYCVHMLSHDKSSYTSTICSVSCDSLIITQIVLQIMIKVITEIQIIIIIAIQIIRLYIVYLS